MCIGRAALWLTIDLVSAHTRLNNIPRSGSLLGPTFVAPLAVVAVYVATSTTRLPKSGTRSWLQLASPFSLAGLRVAYLIPPSPAAELWKGVWALPLVAALHVMTQRRAGAAAEQVTRQHRMHDALTEIGNAAWLTTDRLAILHLAGTAAREQLGDETIVASMSPGTRGQFSASFDSARELPTDNVTKDFLNDLSGVVSVAAERMRLADNLRQGALTDYLTRLPNREALELHLRQALVRTAQKGTRLALLYCDVDKFKLESDQHGHAWGAELLQRLRPICRRA